MTTLGKQSRAITLVLNAIRCGGLVRPAVCEICGFDVDSYNNGRVRRGHPRVFPHKRIVAHHWRGYAFPLDVWWVCEKCNHDLQEHDGSITKEQARARATSKTG